MPISAMVWDFDGFGTYIVCNNYEFAAWYIELGEALLCY
jgi:hypothetical protein